MRLGGCFGNCVLTNGPAPRPRTAPPTMCDALPLIGTSEPVKQVDIFREVNEELSELGQTGHVFKEEFVAEDGEMLANMKIEADNVGQRWGGIFMWHGQAQPGHPI